MKNKTMLTTLIVIKFDDGRNFSQDFYEPMLPIVVGNRAYFLRGHTSNSWKKFKGFTVYRFETEKFDPLCKF